MRLIDSDELKKVIAKETYNFEQIPIRVDKVQEIIDNAPTVEYPFYQEAYQTGYEEGKNERPQVNVIPQECMKVLAEAVVDVVQQIDWKALCEKVAERPQGEYVDISKLRLMTVEECAGHTIDYAMGWKACVEWIKKGGAEE